MDNTTTALKRCAMCNRENTTMKDNICPECYRFVWLAEELKRVV